MTALSRYQRLECPGLWREAPGAQRRDVIVSFGDASLVISDHNDAALAHWSLAAVERCNPGSLPARFVPGPESGEELEIEDETMIAAIGTVIAAIERARPRPGRLRQIVLGSALALVIGLLVFWMPGALRRHTAEVVPPTVRDEIGRQLLARIGRIAGPPCHNSAGDRALARMGAWLLPADVPPPVVLPGGAVMATHLPGGTVLLNRSVIEDHQDIAVTAGFILAERARAELNDPLLQMLRATGPIATFRLLTTGMMSDKTLDDYARTILTQRPAPVPQKALLDHFAAAGVPTAPYARALDPSGETRSGLIVADPLGDGDVSPGLSDADWVRLQGICGG